jgi:hypothetical protein
MGAHFAKMQRCELSSLNISFVNIANTTVGIPDTLSLVMCLVMVSGQPSYPSLEITELLDLVQNAYVGHVESDNMCKELEALRYPWCGMNKEKTLSYLSNLVGYVSQKCRLGQSLIDGAGNVT